MTCGAYPRCGHHEENIHNTNCSACQAPRAFQLHPGCRWLPDPQDTLIYGRRPEDYYHQQIPSRYFTDSNGILWLPTLPDGAPSFRQAGRDHARFKVGGGAVGTGGERRGPYS
ncbi:hypothetical protein F5X99DRAFT_414893 [Biscogniauxia marginata]|nr:hypothetical protein F5X99DRAFT_414893 [Biscogniauxia marginata]